MVEFKYVVTDELGIHARPAGMLVKEAKNYTSAIKITKGEKSTDMNRLMGIMALGVKKGEEVTITLDGVDEESEANTLKEFFANNL